MEIKTIRKDNKAKNEILEISTPNTKIAFAFGEDFGTGDIEENVNPIIDGLTVGNPSYDGVFILRNPENCNILNFTIKTIPIYMDRKLKNAFEMYCDLYNREKKNNIIQMVENEAIRIKDLEITFFIVDPSNYNTAIVKVKDHTGKTVVISGDFRDYNEKYKGNKFKSILSYINHADYVFFEGKYLGKTGLDHYSNLDMIQKIKNIIGQYKQALIIQSETNLQIAYNIYQAALKTNKIFVEDICLSNFSSLANGSSPNPLTSRKAYAYSSFNFEGKDFEFKRKYVNPFYFCSGKEKMKRKKFVLNVNPSMLQDILVLQKQDILYDTCVVFAKDKKCLKKDQELDEFINTLKAMEYDYYEIYNYGKFNTEIINKIIQRLKPICAVALEVEKETNIYDKIESLKLLEENEKINI